MSAVVQLEHVAYDIPVHLHCPWLCCTVLVFSRGFVYHLSRGMIPLLPVCLLSAGYDHYYYVDVMGRNILPRASGLCLQTRVSLKRAVRGSILLL